MNAKQKIGRLEQLLARVQSRASGPRAAAAPASPAYAPVPPPPVVAAAAAPVLQPPPQPQRISSPAPPIVQRYPTPPPDTSLEPATDDVEVSAGGEVEVDIDVDEGMPMESGAHEVAHGTLPPDEAEAEEQASDTSRPPEMAEATEGGEAGEAAFAAPANEIVEPEPSSSPRPIAEEAAESAPRHTPPPESGKQVAAPSVHPPARKSTSPPPSEGHTLIGGWREPGLGQSAQPVISTGVRVPPPQQASPAAPPPQASGTRLSPEVTRAELPQRAEVASFEGAPPAPRPLTFGDLIDAALSL